MNNQFPEKSPQRLTTKVINPRKDYDPAKYLLVVRVVDLNDKQTTEKTLDFKIEKLLDENLSN